MRPKFLFPTLLLFLSAGTAHAQTRVTIGIGTWTLTGEAREETSFSALSRFAASISNTWPLRGAFGFRAEFAYALRGADARTELDGVPVDATINLTYADFPLLLEWEPVPRLTLYGGPSFLYRLDARIRFQSPDGGPSFTENDPTVKRLGWAAVAGAETAIPMGQEAVLLGARFVAGVSNVREDDPPLRHSGLIVYTGFRF